MPVIVCRMERRKGLVPGVPRYLRQSFEETTWWQRKIRSQHLFFHQVRLMLSAGYLSPFYSLVNRRHAGDIFCTEWSNVFEAISVQYATTDVGQHEAA